MNQQTGQDVCAFAEAVKLAANEADIAALTLQDALSLVILTGCKDARLREKMSKLEEPTIAACSTLIDARPAAQDKYEESKAVGNTHYSPVQPIPFPAQAQQPSYYADSCAVTSNNDCNQPTPNMLL